MKRFSVTVGPMTARRHQNIGVGECKHAVVRTIAQITLTDVEFAQKMVPGSEVTDHQ